MTIRTLGTEVKTSGQMVMIMESEHNKAQCNSEKCGT